MGFTARTTESHIAISNLSVRIGARHAPNLHVPELLTRARFTGSYDDFQEAERLSRARLLAHPEDGNAYELRANVLSSLHRFDEAREALDRAEALGRPMQAHQRQRIGLAIATGTITDETEDEARALVERRRSYAHVNTLATLLAARGRFDEADALYIEAAANLRDVSPFSVAYGLFARGVMWAEMAEQPKKARPLYEAAVRRLPEFVVANVHLAEMEAESGDRDQAIARLERVLETGDPEPAGFLSELIADDDPARADTLAARAKARYDVLLERHELAFADHAAEFFMGPGEDAARALRLAEINLASRPTPRAVSVAIEAAVAAGREQRACELINTYHVLRTINPAFDALAAEREADCQPE